LAADTSDTAQEKAAYWHNLSGFLSALGGACAMENTDDLTTSLKETYINPKLINLDPPVPMIESFMQEMVDLLVSDSIWVREKVKETLGIELSPRLNGILLRQIHAVLSDFFDKSTGLPRPAEMFTIFVEQSISVVQMVLKQMASHHEATLGVDIGSLMVLYVEYVNSLGRKDQALRIKISMCQLCEALMEQKSSFLFTNELRVRNRLFQALVTWTSDSVSPESGPDPFHALLTDMRTCG
jgi:neurofibromin 1